MPGLEFSGGKIRSPRIPLATYYFETSQTYFVRSCVKGGGGGRGGGEGKGGRGTGGGGGKERIVILLEVEELNKGIMTLLGPDCTLESWVLILTLPLLISNHSSSLEILF